MVPINIVAFSTHSPTSPVKKQNQLPDIVSVPLYCSEGDDEIDDIIQDVGLFSGDESSRLNSPQFGQPASVGRSAGRSPSRYVTCSQLLFNQCREKVDQM